MSEHNSAVGEAFDLLLEEMGAAIDTVKDAGAAAFRTGDSHRIRGLADQVDRLQGFRQQADNLRSAWLAAMKVPLQEPLLSPSSAAGASSSGPSRSRRPRDGTAKVRHPRLPKGQRTPEEAFYQPVLQALADVGGAAPVRDALVRIEETMRGVLRDVDRQPIGSDVDLPRWANSAQWARNTLARQGYLKSPSRKGIWEISDLGRQALADGRFRPPASRPTEDPKSSR